MADLRKRAVLVVGSAAIGSLSGIGVAVVLSRLLSKEVYGTYRQTLFVYQTLLALLGLNLASSMLFFLPRCETDQERKAFVGQSLMIGPIVGLVIGLAMLVGSRPIAGAMSNPALPPLLLILLPYALLNQVTILVPNTLIAADRTPAMFSYSAVLAVIRPASIIVPFAMGLDIAWVLWSIVAAELVMAGLGVWVIFRNVGATFASFAWSRVRRQMSYTWPLLAAVIVAQIGLQFDKAVIAVTFDTERFAEYANGAMKIPFVLLVVSSLSTSITPDMSRLAGQGKTEEMLSLWQSAAVKGAAFVFPIVGFFVLCPDYVMLILYGPKYLASAIPFAIYCAGLFFRVAYFGTILRAVGRNRLEIVAAVAALVLNVVLTLSIVYLGRGTVWAFAGPAIGTVLGETLAIFVLMVIISRVTGCPVRRLLPLPNLGRAALVVALAAVPALALRLTPLPLGVKVPAMFAAFLLVYGMLVFRVNVLTQRDKEYFFGVAARLVRAVRGAKAAK